MITGLEKRKDQPLSLSDALVSWVLAQVEPWERWRDQQYKDKWAEYYRIWRGRWSDQDKQRQVERSKIITPATQQAVESQVAEMEESIFARKRWFDMEGFDPTGDEELDAEATEIILDFLSEDMAHVGVQQVVTESLLNGGLYGCPIIKILIDKETRRTPMLSGRMQFSEHIVVKYEAVDPVNFVIDPAATSIGESLGVAHIYMQPTHMIKEKQAEGIYDDGYLGDLDESLYTDSREESRPAEEHGTEIIEYHGKVPKALLRKPEKLGEALNVHVEDLDGDELVESIVIISNRTKRLAANENPFIMQDRSFVSCQWDTVPNRFWGRGVVEKAYNAQKALDTEIRARIDALSLSTYPMTIVNTLLAPRSMDSRVTPGKRVAVNGNPAEAMSILKLPGPDQNSYRHANDLERMVQTATGAVAPSSPLGINPTNETASGMSMMLGAMFKRSKRTLRNLEDGILKPLIQKTAWRYMQFAPHRYPFADYRFLVNSGLGASAREFEVAQLSQFLQTMEPGGPEYWIIVRAMLENFSLDAKDELLTLVKGRVDNAINPAPPQPTFDQQIELQKLQLEELKLQLEAQKSGVELQLKAEAVDAEAIRDRGEAAWNQSTAEINAITGGAKAELLRAQAAKEKTAAIKNLADAGQSRVTG